MTASDTYSVRSAVPAPASARLHNIGCRETRSRLWILSGDTCECMRVCACVSVCVCERERERACVCACVCVCIVERHLVCAKVEGTPRLERNAFVSDLDRRRGSWRRRRARLRARSSCARDVWGATGRALQGDGNLHPRQGLAESNEAQRLQTKGCEATRARPAND